MFARPQVDMVLRAGLNGTVRTFVQMHTEFEKTEVKIAYIRFLFCSAHTHHTPRDRHIPALRTNNRVTQENLMSLMEVAFLSVAGTAAALKLGAITVAAVWAIRSLFERYHGVPLTSRVQNPRV